MGNNCATIRVRKIAFVAALLSIALSAASQTSTYKAFIYTDSKLQDEIQRYVDQQMSPEAAGFGDILLSSSLNAAKGLASGYVSSVVDLGVNAVASLVTKKKRMREEWNAEVAAENSFSTRIHTISDLKDFYTRVSLDGPMDPKGMKFDGIGCLRLSSDGDTLFYISMHIDRSKIGRIVEHSKFELVLDTLIISPYHSNLPNSSFSRTFSFEERQNYTMTIKIALSSSWMNQMTQITNDQKLGEFSVCIPVRQEDLDETGFLRYSRGRREISRYPVVGSSFIVPRSYAGMRDKSDKYHDIWGTGEYQLAIDLSETCSVTKQYKDNWKENYKQRRKFYEDESNLLSNTWQFITSQQWDAITESWILTMLQAPAGVVSDELIDKMGLAPQYP